MVASSVKRVSIATHQNLNARNCYEPLSLDFLTDCRFLAFTRHPFDATLWKGTDSSRPWTQSNNPNLYCLMIFLGDLSDFGGWVEAEAQTKNIRKPEISDGTQLITLLPQAKQQASPADVTSQVFPGYLAKFQTITKYSARFLDLYFCESTAAITFLCSNSWLKIGVNDVILSKIPRRLKL